MTRILCLPGGGIRGALTAALLHRLEQAVPGFLAGADLLAGTSTGGLLALGLAAGHPPEAILQLYRDRGRRIFDRRPWRKVRMLGRLLGPRHPAEELHFALIDLFGDAVLGDLGRRVVIPTFDLDSGRRRHARPPRRMKAKIFHNTPGDPDCSAAVVDVARATSAAPSYLPSHNWHIDGGVTGLNDPTMAAVTQVLDHEADPPCPVSDIVCLTVGTGHVPRFIAADTSGWGLARWAPVLPEIMIDGPVDVVAYQAVKILGPRYHRIAVTLPRPIALDDAGSVPELEEIAERVDLAPVLRWLREWWAPTWRAEATAVSSQGRDFSAASSS